MAWHAGTTGGLTLYRQRDGLPDARVGSLYEDADGRLWASTLGGLAFFAADRFFAVDGGPGNEVHAMTGDAQGNLWLASDKGLARVHHGRFIENMPWAAHDPYHPGQLIVADRGGLWVTFWHHSALVYFKDGQVQATYWPTPGQPNSSIEDVRLDLGLLQPAGGCRTPADSRPLKPPPGSDRRSWPSSPRRDEAVKRPQARCHGRARLPPRRDPPRHER